MGFEKNGSCSSDGARVLQLAQGAATVVQPHAMREFGPRKRIDLQDVVQKFD